MKNNKCSTDLDEVDVSLLKLLQVDGRLSNAKASEKLLLSEAPCWRRRKRLEEHGIIRGYQASLDREKLGFGVVAIMHISFGNHTDEEARIKFEDRVRQTPEILSCYHVSGESDYILQVVSRDLASYEMFIRTVMHKLPGVTSIKSNLCLSEIKNSNELPL